MTAEEIVAACELASHEDRVHVFRKLQLMIAGDLKAAFLSRPCDHPKHRIHERPMYNGSVDMVCGRCGVVVERR